MIKIKPAAKGHNSKVQAGPINADRLKSFVERVEKLEEERKAIGGDIKDIYSEAKGVGYDVASMRQIVRERGQDATDRAERAALMDVYRHALGMAVEAVAGGMTYTEAHKEFGFSRSAIHRASHKERSAVSGTVEMTADDLGEWVPPAKEPTFNIDLSHLKPAEPTAPVISDAEVAGGLDTAEARFRELRDRRVPA